MIVCSCNVLSDHDVRQVVNAADDALCNAKQIYDFLGCSAECGRCARTIKTIIDEAYSDLFGVGPTDEVFAPDAGIHAKRAARAGLIWEV